ncbi:MAG: ATP-binding protein, partial [Muribaculaceae bacterium]|nr:ATP-binding protein [Muribaculaceae bacterium]
LTLKNELNELNKLLEMADAMNFPSNATLAMEEAFVNVVNYSHATAITVEVSQHDGSLTIEIADDGDPFDPTQHQTPPDDEAVDQDGFVKVGGKGINLIMSLIKDIAYQRTDEKNILTLKTDI